jgi:4'-phosphopantetheinyl transferase
MDDDRPTRAIQHRPEEVHVWRAWTDASTAVVSLMDACLSESERIRAAKFLHKEDQSRYVFSRGLLRNILATYVGARPEDLTFWSNEFGKPLLDEPFASSDIYFNVSHSMNLVVIAVAFERHIGVDVEFVRSISDVDAIAHRCFTESELELLNGESGSKISNFFRCWTRKEAFVKAIGKGLSVPLNSFTTSLPGGVTSGRLPPVPEQSPIKLWWITDLDVPPDYRSALVNEGDMPTILYREWH